MLRAQYSLSCFLVGLVLLASAAGVVHAEGESPRVGLISTQAAVFNPVNGKVYVVEERHGSVAVVDPITNRSSSVQVGAHPDAIGVNTSNGRVYVTNSGDGTVSVLDPKSNTVIATVRAGPHPYVLAVNSSNGKVYVTNTFSDLVAVIEGGTNTVQMLHAGSADNVAVDSLRSRVFLIGYENPNVRILGEASSEFLKTLGGEHLWGLTVNGLTGAVYVTRSGNAEVVAIESGHTTSIPVGGMPCAVAVNPKTNFVYVLNYRDSNVTAINGSTNTPVATIGVGLHPQALAIDPAANLVYVANTHDNSVTVIDGAKQAALITVPGGEQPFAIAAVPSRQKLVVANLSGPHAYTIVDLGPRFSSR